MSNDGRAVKVSPLEVHKSLKHAKIATKYFSNVGMGVSYSIGKLKRRVFYKAKDHLGVQHYEGVMAGKFQDS